MNKFAVLSALFCLVSAAQAQQLSQADAQKLARLPLHCIFNEYPNKTGHTIDGETDARLLPHELHPAFFGCLDWHSSVHGHWLLVKTLKMYPKIASRDSLVAVLDSNLQYEKMRAEADYFSQYKNTRSFERTYGWAWLLKLDQELATWDDPLAWKWREALRPLRYAIVYLWKEFLPKQTYPNRTGVHPNTAFGMVFALDWARTTLDTSFEKALLQKAKEYYGRKEAAPAWLEPDGTDFLSPSLEVADLMRRVLPKTEFVTWLNAFYTPRSIERLCQLPEVSDRTDMLIVHLDGLALSRAWCMKGIAAQLPASHPLKKKFEATARAFLAKTLPHVTSGNYGGDHWLASFALYALSE